MRENLGTFVKFQDGKIGVVVSEEASEFWVVIVGNMNRGEYIEIPDSYTHHGVVELTHEQFIAELIAQHPTRWWEK